MLHSNASCWAVSGMFSMMDRLVVWAEVWGPLLISKHPRNIYDWPNTGKEGTCNGLAFLDLETQNQQNLYLRESGSRANRERWTKGWRKISFLEQRKDKTAFWLQREAGRQGARRYLCSTWLRSKMTADGCRTDIMDEQMWRQLSKCSNT